MRGGFEAGNKDHFWKLRNILDKAPKLERRLSFSPSFSSDEARIYAASDFLYMLSMDEPFGYSAVKAMTVGAIPIVTHVGGLKDIVIPIDLSGEGNGVVVSVSDSDRYVPNGGYDSTRTDVVPFQIFGATSQALMLHQNEQLRRQAVASGLSFDYLWEGKDGKGPVVQYEQLFHEAIAARKG
jgi:glycosyltransferase involved in cell wall biosynthesis